MSRKKSEETPELEALEETPEALEEVPETPPSGFFHTYYPNVNINFKTEGDSGPPPDLPVPELTALTPSSLFFATPTQVVIGGTGFTPTSEVLVASVPTPATYVSPTEMTVQVSLGSSATPVTVSAGPGTTPSNAGTLSVSAPLITALVPDTGVAAVPVTIVIQGNGFKGSAGVQADGTNIPCTWVSYTEMSATFTPAAEGTVQITVNNNGASFGGISLPVPFTVTA